MPGTVDSQAMAIMIPTVTGQVQVGPVPVRCMVLK